MADRERRRENLKWLWVEKLEDTERGMDSGGGRRKKQWLIAICITIYK